MLYVNNRIKDLREDHDLTQQELATILKIERNTLSGYETGSREPSIGMLISIANYFNVTLDYLLRRTDVDTPFTKIYPSRKYNG